MSEARQSGAMRWLNENPFTSNQRATRPNLLELVEELPITVESRGALYRIERQERVTLDNYDPAKALAGLRAGIGLYKGIDVKDAMKEIREPRTQDSAGRPA